MRHFYPLGSVTADSEQFGQFHAKLFEDMHHKLIIIEMVHSSIHSPNKRLATLDGETADPEITVKLEMRDVLKVHDEQT